MNGPTRTIRIERPLGHHCHRDLSSGVIPPSPEVPAGVEPRPSPEDAPAGHIYSRRRTGMDCDVCGAPEGYQCQPWCLGERYS